MTKVSVIPLVLVASAGIASARQHNYGLAFLIHTPSSSNHNSNNTPKSLIYSSAIDEIPSDVPIRTSSGDANDSDSVLQARNRLLTLSKALTSNSPTGKFITRPSSTKKFQEAIAELEAASSSPTSQEKDLMLGDWKLIATVNAPSSDIRSRMEEKRNSSSGDKKKSWFGLPKAKSDNTSSSLNPIQKSIQKSFQVTQRIRSVGEEEEEGEIDRVDNVIEYTPLDTLEDLLPKESPLSNILGSINVNPLQVKKSKVVLIHKAEVESVSPILRTKIAWTSSVLNVAGTSEYFEESGEDVFGVNNLFGDFLNVGSFDTPFVDGDIRVSRSSNLISEQLRVFVRVGSNLFDENEELLDVVEGDEDDDVESESEEVNEVVAENDDVESDSTENVDEVSSDDESEVAEEESEIVENLEETVDEKENIESEADVEEEEEKKKD